MTTTNTTAEAIADERNEGDREYLLDAIGGPAALKRVRRGGWPGVPAGHIDLCVSATLRDLIAEGVVEVIEVQENSTVTPGKQVTYTYYVIAATQ